MQLMREERQVNRRQATEFVTRMLDSGVMQRWEIDDKVGEAVDLLKGFVDQTLKPADGAAPHQAHGLPGPDLTKPPLPGPATPPGPPDP